MKQNDKGFTLIELMVVIAIMGILIALAAPSFQRILARSEVQTVVSEWRNSFYLAQKEAIRSKHRVILCPSNNGVVCVNGAHNDYSTGWIVLDQTANRLVQDFPPTSGMQNGTIGLQFNVGNGVQLNFLRNGRLPNNFAGGNFQVTHNNVQGVNIGLVVSRAGRVRNN